MTTGDRHPRPPIDHDPPVPGVGLAIVFAVFAVVVSAAALAVAVLS